MLFESEVGSTLYSYVRSSEPRRRHVERLWQRFEPYAERGFIEAFPFHIGERYWEMFVGCSLLDSGLEPCRKWASRGNNKGLDFKLCLPDGQTLWVEAVACGPGDPLLATDPANVVPRIDQYPGGLSKDDDGGYVGGQHLTQLSLRVATAFKSKLKQAGKQASKNDLVVVAIGGGGIDSIIWHDNLPDGLAVASLFCPFRNTNCIDLSKGFVLERAPFIPKVGACKPPSKPFEQEGADLNSGVLFSARSIVSASYQWEDELIWISNYGAARRLELTAFERHFHSILTRVEGNQLLINSRPKAH
jgi:hypothetical protein